jgi:hypothetical protein
VYRIGRIRALYTIAALDNHVGNQVFSFANADGDFASGRKVRETGIDQLEKSTFQRTMIPSGHRFLAENAIEVLAVGIVVRAEVFFEGN